MKELLFISNGHGEDIIATAIIKELLLLDNNLKIKGLSLVGKGSSYLENNISLISNGQDLPSGGFVMTSKDLLKDIKAGLLQLTFSQLKALFKNRGKSKAIIAVGDTYPLLLSAVFSKGKKFFISTAKSSYVGAHNKLELFIMKRFVTKTFTRDLLTKDYLQNQSIESECYGNVMMDTISFHNENFQLEKEDITIGILPGSRQESYENLKLIANIIKEIQRKKLKEKVVFLIAISKSLDIDRVKIILEKYPNIIISEKFGDIIKNSQVILGLAGTANEQAIGLGKPVVAFPALGPQTSHYRFRLQKRLLGNSIELLDEYNPQKIANTLLALIVDKHKQKKVQQIGKERMGPPGAASKIAKDILNYI